MDWWTLIFAAVAAIAAILAATWGWTDRPQHGWHIRREIEEGTPTRKPRVTFTVRAVGTAVVHNVEVRVAGALHCESSTGLFQPQMGTGSDPIIVAARLSGKPESQTHVEIIWTRLRPYREYAQRVEARSLKWETWRWRWSSIRLRARPNGGWWTTRLVRTSGAWVPDRRKPRVEIPLTGKPKESPLADDGCQQDETPPS